MAKRQAGGSEDVIDELRRQYDRLTQSQKRIAEYIVDHPDRVAFSTVDQMAGQLGVNPSTIVRFTYRLGLKGFPDLQERTRTLVRGQLSAASEIVNENSVLVHLEGTAFGTSLGQDLQNLRRTISAIKVEDLQRASDIIAAARQVFVAGSFNAYSVAFFLGLALDRIRGHTTVWSGDMTLQASQSLGLGPDDCLIAFTSAPYAVSTQRAALLAKEARAKVIAVTDTPISAVGQIADVILAAASTGAGLQNSFVAAMAIANALLNGVAAANSELTLERYGRLAKVLGRLDAFLLKADDAE
ncbi:MAG TPA: MurR/RpiR family transcriptional regulator [Xanthobacteraceae bacterium]|jgi:DNA-binding MurR/RpiR family transcriptional regulator